MMTCQLLREALLEKLLVTLHLTVPERQMLGSDDVTLAEVEAVVKRLLESDGVFPPDAKVWQRGEVVFEGVFLVTNSACVMSLLIATNAIEWDFSNSDWVECGSAVK